MVVMISFMLTISTQHKSFCLMVGESSAKVMHTSPFPPPICFKEHSPLGCYQQPELNNIYISHQCQWVNQTSSFDLYYVWESMDADDESLGSPERFDQQACFSENGWAAFKVGPFYTAGGESWTGIRGLLSDRTLKKFHHDIYAFDEYVLGNVDEHDQLIGYPPIHQHHFHLFGSGSVFDETMNNHADSQCAGREGGVNCLVRTAPPGYAWMLAPRLGFASEFNDVRPLYSKLLPSWVYVALKSVNPKDKIQIRQLRYTFHPSDISLYLKGRRNTFSIPTDLEHVGWSSHQMPAEVKETIEVYLHTHPGMIEDIWVFQGAIHEVFSFGTRFIDSENTVLSGPDVIAEALMSIRRRRQNSSAAQLACAYKTSSTPETICISNVCRVYWRRARCALDLRISTLVMVAFFRKQEPLPEFYRMHVLMRIYYASDDRAVKLRGETNLTREELIETARVHGNLNDPLARAKGWRKVPYVKTFL